MLEKCELPGCCNAVAVGLHDKAEKNQAVKLLQICLKHHKARKTFDIWLFELEQVLLC